MHRRIPVLLAALAAAAGLLAAGAPAVAAPEHAAAHSPGTYRNPLALALPGGGTAGSCADPFVYRGGGRHVTWYLYCTSDSLTDAEASASGGAVIHLVPTFSSTDLTHWTYRGDAFAKRPSWLAATAGMWAPDVVRDGRRYLLYYAASDTNLPGGGSAIGVATGPTPVGPWTDTGTPVVAPADIPGQAGVRRATIDPDIVRAGNSTYVYFGSYPGGLFARRLAAGGLTSVASSERRIAIDQRYEGTDVVRHGGWYYLLASSTNCCNGALTGYGVFAARSRSPLGPFLDRDGRSILASKVGGTPVLQSNGDRWTGPGHDDVITDFGGQQWIVYHAVDRADPVYAGTTTYTKRPVLMDPLDWSHGWPVVRGGRGPSDGVQPAPAAQPGQRSAYRAHVVAPVAPGRVDHALSDSFGGTALASRWSWIRTPDAYTVHGGRLDLATQDADIHPPATPLASVLTEPAPRGDYTVTAKVRMTTPGTGDLGAYVQGGLLLYGSDADYVKLTITAIGDTRQTEFGRQAAAFPAGGPTYGNGVVGPVGDDWTWLRVTRHVVEGHVTYTASTSIDGRHWDTGGTWVADLGAHARIGLISAGGAGYTTEVDQVVVQRR